MYRVRRTTPTLSEWKDPDSISQGLVQLTYASNVIVSSTSSSCYFLGHSLRCTWWRYSFALLCSGCGSFGGSCTSARRHCNARRDYEHKSVSVSADSRSELISRYWRGLECPRQQCSSQAIRRLDRSDDVRWQWSQRWLDAPDLPKGPLSSDSH